MHVTPTMNTRRSKKEQAKMDEARKRSKLLDGYEGPLTGEDQKISVLQ